MDKRGHKGGFSPAHAYDPQQNTLLGRLLEELGASWEPLLEYAEFGVEDTLLEAGEEPRNAWFPTTGVVAMVASLSDGMAARLAVIGSEGVVHGGGLAPGQRAPARFAIVCEGGAYRVPSWALQAAFDSRESVRRLLLRHHDAVMAQAMQSALCNRYHSPRQQVCSLLLSLDERLRRDEIALTHDQIAGMLGLRRETVTQAARKLQARGLVHYRRGHIHLLDRRGIEAGACECYRSVRREYERLLP